MQALRIMLLRCCGILFQYLSESRHACVVILSSESSITCYSVNLAFHFRRKRVAYLVGRAEPRLLPYANGARNFKAPTSLKESS